MMKIFNFSDNCYNAMKEFAQIWIPAIGALYFGLAQIWGLPYGEEIVGTLTVVDTFLGAILKISTVQYNKELKG